jgi:membrane peptidoglycan carboxypeptidase
MPLLLLKIIDFYEHGGIDYRGTLRAFVTNITGGEVQGGSTITQQLAKNAFPDPGTYHHQKD